MAQLKATFDGGVVADPEFKEVAGNTVQEFPVYINHSRKNKETQQYDPTGDVTKIRVSLWRDLAQTKISKGDIVQVTASLVEKEWPKQDGSKGRQLQTDFVESIEVRWSKAPAAPVADAGSIPTPTAGVPVPVGF